MSQKYICIEGNIGSGKTTFTKKYAEITGATPIYEQFSDNPFLESFYSNPKQHAFPLEMSFLSERFQQLNNIFSKPDLFAKSYVSDYTFLKTLIFAKNNLSKDEFELFKNFFHILNKKLRRPDLVVYLQTDVDYLAKNINSRGRNYEKLIKTTYLQNINNGYKSLLLNKLDIPILLIPYNNDAWDKLDTLIFQIAHNANSNQFKKGIQLF